MAIILFGNGPELHDRLAGEAGSFAAVEAQLTTADAVIIPVRRANAFHLATIVSWALARRGAPNVIAALDPHPLTTLPQRFADHLMNLHNAGISKSIQLIMDDQLLEPLLSHLAEKAQSGPETDLLRLLGILCDTALVGPHWFVFEIINRCNARCLYCNIHAPTRRPSRDFLTQQLPFEMYARTVEDLARMGTDGVTILANGEPLLHPDFIRMIHHAKQHGLRTNFFTNGLLLGEKQAGAILESQTEEMFCTVSAASAATYARLHADVDEQDWAILEDNLRRFFTRRADTGTKRPMAWMVNVICSANAREILAMAEWAAQLGFDGLRPQLLRVDEFNRPLALKMDEINFLREALPKLEGRCAELGLTLWDAFAFQLRHAGDNPDAWSGDEFIDRGCFIGWALGLAKANGDLSFCCTVKPVANLADAPFHELWTGGRYQEARLAAKDLRHAGDLILRDGQTLYTDACHHCDNHDINRRMHQLLSRYDLWRFLG